MCVQQLIVTARDRAFPWPLGKHHNCEVLYLTQLQSWSLQRHRSVECIWIDIDALAASQPSELWALDAWKAEFRELIVQSRTASGKHPNFLAYTQSPSWESARLAYAVGARNILTWEEASEFKINPPHGPIGTQTPRVTLLGRNLNPRSDDPSDRLKHPQTASDNTILFPMEGLEGQSQAVEKVRQLIRRLAPQDTSVFIEGPTGSGKELVAHSIHRHSRRAQRKFVIVNCASIHADVFDSLLFGTIDGASEGSQSNKRRYLHAAEGGTLFLDEISALPLNLQSRLLRAIQEKVVTPVGSNTPIACDVRFLAATQQNIEERVQHGLFREDLYFRLKVMTVNLPSLHERIEDIPELIQSQLGRLARKLHRRPLKASDEVIEKFLFYHWPGNIRELDAFLEYSAALAWAEARTELMLKDLPETLRYLKQAQQKSSSLKIAVKRFEKRHIAETVRRVGSKEKAAEVLKLSLASLYRKLGA